MNSVAIVIFPAGPSHAEAAQVQHECPGCALKRHDADAIHCKHCGRVIHIETEGIT